MKNVGIVLLAVLCLMVGAPAAWGQSTGDYRSAATGPWNVLATWQRYDGTAWVTPTTGQGTPTNTSGVITILNGHTVTVGANVTVDQVVVAAGGQITVSSTFTLTVANGTGTDLSVSGTVSNAGIITTTGALMAVLSGGKYQHNQSAGTVPTATWDANSTFEYLGSNTGNPTPGGMGQTFGHFTLNSTTGSGTSEVRPNACPTAINGNFTVLGTGAAGGSWRITRNTACSFSVAGNVSISGANSVLTFSNGTGAMTMNVAGNWSHTAGTLTETGTASGNIVFTAGSHTFSSSGTVNNTVNYTVNSGSTVTLTTSGSTGSSTGTFTVASGGTLDATSVALTGSAKFTLASGGTLKIGDAAGITTGTGATGSIRVTGTRTYTAGANYVYDGGVSQLSGTGLTQNTPGSLTVSGTNTYLTLSAATTVTNAIVVGTGTLDQGCTLNLSGASLTLQNNGNYINCNSTSAGGTGTLTLGGITVNSGSTFDYVGTGTITLSGNVSNGGTVLINGGGRSGGIPDCNGTKVLITASAPAKTWGVTGSGKYLIADVNVVQQAASPGITVYGGLTVGSGRSGWTSSSTPSPGSGNPTAVTMISSVASQTEGGILLQWQTGWEADNLGFHVYREDNGQRVRLTESPVAGSALMVGAGTQLTAGNSYSWEDPEGNASSVYYIEDLHLTGQKTLNGPASVMPGNGGAPRKIGRRSMLLSRVGRAGMDDARWTWSRPAESRVPSPEPNRFQIEQQLRIAAGPAVKIGVQADGWYWVGRAQLIAAGLPADADARRLQLLADGVEQPILVQGEEHGQFESVEFYGIGLDTPWSGTRTYWLTSGQHHGKRISSQKVHPDRLSGITNFPYTIEWKPRTTYTAVLKNGDKDNFFGPTVTADPVDQSLMVVHLDKAAADQPKLQVALQGVTEGSHNVAIQFNGQLAGNLMFTGMTRGVTTLSIPAAQVKEGANILSLVAQGGPSDVSQVDRVQLTYTHDYVAVNNALRCTAPAGQLVTIDGFSSKYIRVLDVTDASDASELQGQIDDRTAGFSVAVTPGGHGIRTLLAITESQISVPASLAANRPSSWHSEQRGADMVMIGHADFLPSLAPLKALRESQGLTVAVVDVEDLYDEFSFGAKSPCALKSFLSTAAKEWLRKPRYVLLAGDATFDPRGYLGLGNYDFVPTKLVATAVFETASDDWFVDLNNDGAPDIAVGRLPIRTAAQAGTMVYKIVAREAGSGSWKSQALLVSDKNDAENKFEAYSAEVKALLPSSYSVSQILRGSDPMPHDNLLSGLNAGKGLVNYFGHGSTEIWAGPLFSSAEAMKLTNGNKLPFVVTMTCLNGFFHDLYTETLAEALMKAPAGGAAAVWASSGLTESGPQLAMDKAMLGALFAGPGVTIGQATAAAKKAVLDMDVRRTWILFGDPAMKMQ